MAYKNISNLCVNYRMVGYRLNQYISQKPTTHQITTHKITTIGEEVKVSMLMFEEDNSLYKLWIKI